MNVKEAVGEGPAVSVMEGVKVSEAVLLVMGVELATGVRLAVGALDAVNVIMRMGERLDVGVIVPVEVGTNALVVIWVGDPVGVKETVLEGDGLEVKVGIWLGVSVGVNVQLAVFVWGRNGVRVGNAGSRGAARVSEGAAVEVGVAVSNKAKRGLISAGSRQPISEDPNNNAKRTIRLCKDQFLLKHTGNIRDPSYQI